QQVRCVVVDGRVRVAAAGFTDRGAGDVEGGGIEAESGNVFSVGAQAAADHNRPPAMTVNSLRISPPGQQWVWLGPVPRHRHLTAGALPVEVVEPAGRVSGGQRPGGQPVALLVPA